MGETTQRQESPAPPPSKGDLLTVVENVYFHPADRDIRQMDSRWCRNLGSFGEQPYERYLKANKEWQALDLGWIGEVGMLVIKNEEGTSGLRTEPLPESALGGVIEVCYAGAKDSETDSFLILPGESFRPHPKTPRNLRIRCPSGTARYHLFIIPR